MNLLPVTEADGEWVGEAMEGVLPSELDSRIWVQEDPVEVEGNPANKFRLRGQNLVVLATIAPVLVRGSEEKQASYHLIVFREEEQKIKKPNEADINRARSTFICRELKNEEMVYEGTVGNSRAHHIMTVFRWSPIVLVG